MKRLICFLKQSQLCWIVSLVIIWRMSVRPDGSPIIAVPPPIRAIGLLPAMLQTLHQAKCHEVSDMKAVCGRVKADVKRRLSVVYEITDLFFICYLCNQSSCDKFVVNLHDVCSFSFLFSVCSIYIGRDLKSSHPYLLRTRADIPCYHLISQTTHIACLIGYCIP